MSLLEIVTLALTALGVLFIFLSSVGLIRLPDVYTRVHASGKSATLGVVGVLLGVAVYYVDLRVALEMLALIVFFFITAPVAAHMLDRAAYLTGVKPVAGTAPDDLEGAYNRETRSLR